MWVFSANLEEQTKLDIYMVDLTFLPLFPNITSNYLGSDKKPNYEFPFDLLLMILTLSFI